MKLMMPDQGQSSSGKGKTQTKAAIDNKKKLVFPLDFSFKDLGDVSELPSEEAREILPGKKPERSGQEDKYHGTSLKLNNNMLKDITGLPAALESLMFNPMELTWIDLSCNELSTISEVLCDFRSLQILYLQGNTIKDIRQVDKLAGMPKLRKLNLHGNPIDREKGYRLYCIKMIPQLQHFDCSLVTKADRKTAECFRLEPRKRRKKEED